jgi:hypothetical protein
LTGNLLEKVKSNWLMRDVTMQPMSDEQIRFLVQIQRLLDEGLFVATYKFVRFSSRLLSVFRLLRRLLLNRHARILN